MPSLSFIAVLWDPQAGEVLGLPLIAETPQVAVSMIQDAYPDHVIRTLFDRSSVVRWRQQLLALPALGAACFAVVLVQHGRSEVVLIVAANEIDAVEQLRRTHVGWDVNGIFSRDVLTDWIGRIDGLVHEVSDA